MGLKAKFNLVMLLAFLVGLALAAALSWRIVHENARREVVQQAAVMMAQAIRHPRLHRQGDPAAAGRPDQGALPAAHRAVLGGADQSARALRAVSRLHLQGGALNPTNPADRADRLGERTSSRNSARALAARISPPTRDSPDRAASCRSSRPIRITDKDCLTCHSTPSAAPASMIDLYGSANGFGWKLGDVIGAQIVSVPMQVALDRGQ